MRATLNIVCGFLLLVMQSMATIAPHTVDESTVCQCCSCGSMACSPTQNAPAPTPSPLAAQQQVSNVARKVSIPAPTPTPGYVSSQLDAPRFSSDFNSCPSGQPLYRRHCALLI